MNQMLVKFLLCSALLVLSSPSLCPAQVPTVVGRPVIPKMLELIAESPDSEIRAAARTVIRGILASMPEKVWDKFMGETLHERGVVRSAETQEQVTDRVIVSLLRNPRQKPIKPQE